jgi:general secretion pathway protein A
MAFAWLSRQGSLPKPLKDNGLFMYEDYYRFSAKPFQLNPDPRFFFGSKGHKRAMAYLDYGLSLGEGFIVITGEVGAGKTTLVRNLFRQLESHNLVAAQLVSTQLDAEDTLRSVAASFGLEHEGLTKSALLKNIEDFFIAATRQGKRVLLVVDEAQNLTPRAVEELRMLSNFQNDERSLIQTFLLGQPEFRGILQSPTMQQLRQRVVASYHLGPLDADETRGYIEHRLRTVGWEGVPGFGDDAFAELHRFTGGIPRRLNTTCDRLLLFGFLEEKSHFGEAEVNEVIADLRNEIAHQDFTGATGLNGQPASESRVSSEDTARLVQRVEQMERSVNRILPIVRKILYTVSERNAADDGTMPDNPEMTH